MKREELAALGIKDETVLNKIMDLHGADLTKLQNTVNTLTTERDGLKTQLGDANTKLTGYDPDWKNKADTAAQNAQKQIDALKFDYALNDALKAYKARDVVAVKAHLKTDGLKLDGDTILGLKDQLESVKKDAGFLFDDDQATGPTVKLGGPTPGAAAAAVNGNEVMNNALREALGHGGNQ